MNSQNKERETHLNLVADDRGTWDAYSDDPVMILKLDRVAEFIEERGFGRYCKLDKGHSRRLDEAK